jgi:hypothetical protein
VAPIHGRRDGGSVEVLPEYEAAVVLPRKLACHVAVGHDDVGIDHPPRADPVVAVVPQVDPAGARDHAFECGPGALQLVGNHVAVREHVRRHHKGRILNEVDRTRKAFDDRFQPRLGAGVVASLGHALGDAASMVEVVAASLEALQASAGRRCRGLQLREPIEELLF